MIIRKVYLSLFFIFLFFIIFFTFNHDKKINIEAKNLDANCICSSDGMIIIDYSGPKGQILWNDGSRTFYCEAREGFYELFDVLNSKKILAFFVQDFSNVNWGSYVDKWINSKDAIFVIDSSINGAMGVSYVPFSSIDAALNFKNIFGGNILNFSDINLDILIKTNELIKDRI